MTHRSTLLRLASILCVASGVSVPSATGGDLRPLHELAFLAGNWVGESGQVEMEEIWTEPKGGVMLGLHRDVAPGKAAFFEFLRIGVRDGRVICFASPRGCGGTEFLLSKIEDSVVVFENFEPDYPQRIVYRRDGDRLTARIEGGIDGQLAVTEWTWCSAR